MRARSSRRGARLAPPGVCALLIAACGGGGHRTVAAGNGCTTEVANASAASPSASGSWPYPNANLANTRVAPDSSISATNVSKLEPAWTFKLTGKAAAGEGADGALAANPVAEGGVVYLQDIDSNVYALALGSGKLDWEYRCNAPERSGPGPNGVAVADGRVYGETPTSVFALSTVNGKAVWTNTHVLSRGQGTFGIQPEAADGRVYLASQYGNGPGGGVLIAVNASTGAVLWKFNTLVGPAPGVRKLGLGAGGAWETPLVSGDGSVTYGVGNPYQTPTEALAQPAAMPYTNSEVKLDAATGKLRWYYQAVPNDFKDYDLQTSPISAQVGGAPVVIGSGKMGYVYEMNADTGKLIWKTPVGQHNGHDNDSLKALEHKIKLSPPYTILPGSIGGVLSDLATAGNSVYVSTINLALTYTTFSIPVPVKAAGLLKGDVEALNLATGKVQWDTKVPSLPVGAVTVSNDLLLTTVYSGRMIAIDRRTGRIAYQRKLPTTVNAPLAIAGRTVIIPAGSPGQKPIAPPQVLAYALKGAGGAAAHKRNASHG